MKQAIGTNPFRVAARLIFQYHLSIEDAFLGVWYLNHTQPPRISYYKVRDRISRFNPLKIPPIPEETMEACVKARQLGPNPWELRKLDPTYCRLCYRAKAWRGVLCKYCYNERRLNPNQEDRLFEFDIRYCAVPGCEEPHLACGRCRRHYQQAWREGTLWRPAAEQNTPIDWSTVYLPRTQSLSEDSVAIIRIPIEQEHTDVK